MLFLLGAGFNIDANTVARDAGLLGRDHPSYYPLVANALKLCFGLRHGPDGKSVEDLFSDAIEANDVEPMRKLTEHLMAADCYIANPLATSPISNCYRIFFERFQECDFLTFNYDSFVETFLFRMGSWIPNDGYGVNAEVAYRWNRDKSQFPPASKSKVLHLHGSLCVYAKEFENDSDWLVQREQTIFSFDPNLIAANFEDYDHKAGSSYRPAAERVIAPIPSKASGLKEVFVEAVYKKAIALVKASGNLVALGYSFNEHDRESWEPILTALAASSCPRLLVVSIEAKLTAARLAGIFPELEIEPVEQTLKTWIEGSFQGATG